MSLFNDKCVLCGCPIMAIGQTTKNGKNAFASLSEENAALREALEFYADEENWEVHDAYDSEERGFLWHSRFLPDPQDYSQATHGTIMKCGKRAREVLARYKGKKHEE